MTTDEPLKTFEVTIKFLCEVRDREDAMARTRLMFGDLPLPGLRIDAARAPHELEHRMLDRDSAKRQIEADTDHGISFVGDVMGAPPPTVVHPWQQGMWLFPDDHPLAPYEKAAKAQNDTRALDAMKALTRGEPDGEEGTRSLSLTSGSGDADESEHHDQEVVEGELLGE